MSNLNEWPILTKLMDDFNGMLSQLEHTMYSMWKIEWGIHT